MKRTGEYNCLITILDFQTLPDGAGGTNYVILNDDNVTVQFGNHIADSNGTVESSNCTSYLGEFLTDRVAWAYVNQKVGSRSIDSNKIELDNATEMYFNYDDVSDISKTWRLEYDSRLFTIHSYEIIREKRVLMKVKAFEVK
jgi:head-tail adaptor